MTQPLTGRRILFWRHAGRALASLPPLRCSTASFMVVFLFFIAFALAVIFEPVAAWLQRAEFAADPAPADLHFVGVGLAVLLASVIPSWSSRRSLLSNSRHSTPPCSKTCARSRSVCYWRQVAGHAGRNQPAGPCPCCCNRAKVSRTHRRCCLGAALHPVRRDRRLSPGILLGRWR